MRIGIGLLMLFAACGGVEEGPQPGTRPDASVMGDAGIGGDSGYYEFCELSCVGGRICLYGTGACPSSFPLGTSDCGGITGSMAIGQEVSCAVRQQPGCLEPCQ